MSDNPNIIGNPVFMSPEERGQYKKDAELGALVRRMPVGMAIQCQEEVFAVLHDTEVHGSNGQYSETPEDALRAALGEEPC